MARSWSSYIPPRLTACSSSSPRKSRGPVQFGDFELIPLSDGTIRLDGGGMFGTVPKPLWEKRAPADAFNRIELGLRPLLVRGAGHTLLIDAGVGGKMD